MPRRKDPVADTIKLLTKAELRKVAPGLAKIDKAEREKIMKKVKKKKGKK